MKGLEAVPSRFSGTFAPSSSVDAAYDADMRLRERLAGLGFHECQTIKLISDGQLADALPLKPLLPGDTIRVSLPLSEDHGVSARVIMGSLWDATSPITQHAATIYADILMNAGATIPIDAEADERAVLVALGDASLDGEALDRYSLYILKPGQAMTLRAETDARVMLLGGEAFTTPRHVWWNFVSSSRDRINEAKAEWKERKFPLVPGDSEEFIPIPEVPKTVSYP